jgi:hypothetical protein
LPSRTIDKKAMVSLPPHTREKTSNLAKDFSKPGAFMKSRPPPKMHPHRKRPLTFAAIRRDAENRLARGLKLDFDQIMLDITALIADAKKPI